MTAKARSTRPVQPTAPVAKKPAAPVAEKPAVNFDNLPPARVVEFTTKPRIDVESQTPAVIKTALQNAYDVNVKLIAENKQTKQILQVFVSELQGEAFVALAKKYATFRGWTLRGGTVMKIGDPNNGIESGTPFVRLTVVPKETKTRKPATK